MMLIEQQYFSALPWNSSYKFLGINFKSLLDLNEPSFYHRGNYMEDLKSVSLSAAK